ncbi:MAG: DsbA family oxidoreductase [Caulobacter sp.]|nr:DsbA family oxidoreductase [Caulobacter sp.]
MQIDFIADVVCPWCYLGWRRLEKALAMRPDLEATITWRPYQLDPTLPEEGVDRKAYYAAKFPDPERREAGAKVLNAAAAEDGITWNLADIPVSPNTNAAHRLIRWAQGEGLQGPVLEGVLAAYFTELRDIGDPVVLADIGEKAGMDRMRLLQAFSEGTDKDAVSREHFQAHQAGVSGVPFMIFDGKIAVSGAEPPERLVKAIDKAREMAA